MDFLQRNKRFFSWHKNKVFALLFTHVALAVALILVINFIISSTKNDPPKNHSIVLGDQGFTPSEITIKKGDSVTFTTTRGRVFWPASDLHPTHAVYSEFDPKAPVNQDESWTFVFHKTGIWSFHDHLAPLFLGVINVVDNLNSKRLASVNFQNLQKCEILSKINEKIICWEKSLGQVLDTQGIVAGFSLYSEYYDKEPYFAENCHGFTHKIGEASYKLYSQNKDFDLTSQVAYCSYGFFHGFIEAMFHNTGTLDQARDFCGYIDNKLRGQTYALGACLHGIGHGVTDASDPRAWGDVHAIIEPGKKLCEKVGKDDYEKSICGSGVFNSLEVIYQDPKYKLVLDKKDPFWICRQQEEGYFKHACFTDFKDIIMVISNQDFAKAAIFVEGIKDDYYAQAAIDNLATYAAYNILRQPSYDYAIDICHALQPRLHVDCISGLGAGFMTAGTPDLEYVKAVELCHSSRITKSERAGCFKRVLHASSLRYSPMIHQRVCGLVSEKDKKDIGFCS